MKKFNKTIFTFLLIFMLLANSVIPVGATVVTVDNLAPVVGFDVEKRKTVDLQVALGNTSLGTSEQIQSALDQKLRPILNENGYDLNLNIKNNLVTHSESNYKLIPNSNTMASAVHLNNHFYLSHTYGNAVELEEYDKQLNLLKKETVVGQNIYRSNIFLYNGTMQFHLNDSQLRKNYIYDYETKFPLDVGWHNSATGYAVELNGYKVTFSNGYSDGNIPIVRAFNGNTMVSELRLNQYGINGGAAVEYNVTKIANDKAYVVSKYPTSPTHTYMVLIDPNGNLTVEDDVGKYGLEETPFNNIIRNGYEYIAHINSFILDENQKYHKVKVNSSSSQPNNDFQIIYEYDGVDYVLDTKLKSDSSGWISGRLVVSKDKVVVAIPVLDASNYLKVVNAYVFDRSTKTVKKIQIQLPFELNNEFEAIVNNYSTESMNQAAFLFRKKYDGGQAGILTISTEEKFEVESSSNDNPHFLVAINDRAFGGGEKEYIKEKLNGHDTNFVGVGTSENKNDFIEIGDSVGIGTFIEHTNLDAVANELADYLLLELSNKKTIDLKLALNETSYTKEQVETKINSILKPRLSKESIRLNLAVDYITLQGGKIDTISGGYYHSHFLLETGEVYATGFNNSGQLGIGNTTDQYTPVLVNKPWGDTKVISISDGADHSLFLLETGEVYATGYNGYGPLGIGNTTTQHTPVPVNKPWGDTKVVGISGGTYHSLFLLETGEVYATGYNGYGQLGNGNTTNQHTPVPVNKPWGDKKVISIDAGTYHSLFLLETGEVYATGYNYYGGLGIGNTTNQYTPVPVNKPWGDKKIISIEVGTYYSLFLLETGEVYATGYNVFGQLGNGNTTNQYTPVPVNTPWGGKKVVGISGGELHSLFLLETGEVYATGYNVFGQLGNGNTTNQYTPVLVKKPWGDRKVISIDAGTYHSLFLLETGEVYTTGDNDYGQLGIGNTTDQYTPVPVNEPWGDTKVQMPQQSINDFWTPSQNPLFAGFLTEVEVDSTKLSTNLQSKDADFIGLGNSINQSQLEEVITHNDGQGVFLDSTDLDLAIENLADYITNTLAYEKSVDLVFGIGNTEHNNLDMVESKVNQIIRPMLNEEGIEVKNVIYSPTIFNQSFSESTSQTQTHIVNVPNVKSISSLKTTNGNVQVMGIKGDEVTLKFTNGSWHRYVQTGGSYTPSDSRSASDSCSNTAYYSYDKNGYLSGSSYSGGSNLSCPDSMYYSSGGYSGTLYRGSTSGSSCPSRGTPYGSCSATYTAYYSGTVYRPASDTRTYAYYYQYSVTFDYMIDIQQLTNPSSTIFMGMLDDKSLSDVWKSEILEASLTNEAYIVGLGKDINQPDFEQIINSNMQKGTFINNTNLDQALRINAEYIIDTISKMQNIKELYVTLEEQVKYFTYYDDYENDPHFADNWRYDHVPNVFENDNGLAIFNQKNLPTPIEQFSNVGRYQPLYAARDNPIYWNDERFDNYRKWSKEADNWYIYAHRKPVPEFTVTLDKYTGAYSIQNRAYDLDKQSIDIGYGGGILSQAFSWRKQGESTWQEGLPTSPINKDTIYEIRNTVVDFQKREENMVKLMSVKNLPPVANFDLPTEVMLNEPFSISNRSYDPNTDNMTAKWYWKPKGASDTAYVEFASGGAYTNGVGNTNWNPSYSFTTPGDYTIKLVVTDTSYLFDTLTKDITILNPNDPPTAEITVAATHYIGDTIHVINNSSDPNNDLLTYTYTVTKPDGTELIISSGDTRIDNNGDLRIVANQHPTDLGNWQFTIEVSDGQATAIDSASTNVLDQTVQGTVSHTDQWYQNIQKFNIEYPSKAFNLDASSDLLEFFKGERFMLQANETNLATQIAVQIKEYPQFGTAYLTENTTNVWKGSLWNGDMFYTFVDQEVLTFEFIAVFQNGWIARNEIKVRIRDDDYWTQHTSY